MPDPANPNPLNRFLRLFADVRPGESFTALLLATNVFLLLTAYYIIKPIRDGLIIGAFGADVTSYTSAGAVFLLAMVVPLYGKLADRVPRRHLINIATLFFIASFVGFYGLWVAGLDIGIVFYAWVAVFNLMVVAQFWSFANDVYQKEEGERLFPIVAFGQSLGAVVGTTYVEQNVAELGLGLLLLIGAGMLFVQLLMTNYIDHRERTAKEGDLPEGETSAQLSATGELRIEDISAFLEKDGDHTAADDAGPDGGNAASKSDNGPRSVGAAARETDQHAGDGGAEDAPGPAVVPTSGAFALVFRVRYLLMIGLLMMLLNLVNTTGEYILNRSIADAAAEITGQTSGIAYTEQITIIKAGFFRVVNIAGLLIQLFIVSRVVQFFGVAFGLMILPMIALGGYAFIAFLPIFPVIRWAKTLENANDYSLNNTVRQMLFLPTTREQKYKAKQTIDSFFSRVGDTLQAVVVYLGTAVFALSISGFAVVNMVVVVVWLFLAFRIGRRYKELVESGEPPG